MTQQRVPGWLIGVAAAAAAAVAVAYFAVAADLGPSGEDRAWEAVFRGLGLRELFGRTTGSYRPLCGAFLLAEEGLGLTTAGKHRVAALLHAGNLLLLAGLVARIGASARLGLLAGLLAACWSSADEVLVWLGGRCDLLEVSLGLVGSHLALAAIARPRALTVAGATACTAAACLVKEPGFGLPLLWLAYAWSTGRPMRPLLPPLAAAALLLIVRTTVARGLGSYVALFVGHGPVGWAGQAVQAAGSLLLGTGFDAGPLALIIAALATSAGLGWLIWMQEGVRRRAGVAFALLVLLGPCALLYAPRCLYPAVMALAGLIAFAAARSGRAQVLVALFLLAQASSSVASLRSWQSAYRARREGVAALARLGAPQVDLVLVAARNDFAGRPIGPVFGSELPQARAVRQMCRPQESRALARLLDLRAPATRTELPAPPLHRVVARFSDPCTAQVAPIDLRCAEDSVAASLGGGRFRVHVAPESRPATIAYVDAAGALRTQSCPR